MDEFQNEKGKIPPRLVDIGSELAKLSFKNQHFIKPNDFKSAEKVIDDPQRFDVVKILNWDHEEVL